MTTVPTVLAVLAGLVALALVTVRRSRLKELRNHLIPQPVAGIQLHFLLLLFTPQPTRTHHSEKLYTTTPSSQPTKLPKLTDAASIRLSVVVPAYNEEERLGVMIDEVMEYFLSEELAAASKEKESSSLDRLSEKTRKTVQKRREGGVEVIIVDDGSADATSRVGMELSEKWEKKMQELGVGKASEGGEVEIRVVRMKKNRGKGGAVQHGVLHSRGSLILFADADGASRFSDLDLLLDAMEKVKDADGHGMVVGSRAHLVRSEAVVKRSLLRNLLMHGFHLFLRTLGVGGIRDTQCGFKLFTRPTALHLFPTLHLPRWSFDVELLLLASLTTPPIPVAEIPIAWHEVNGSKIRLGWDSIGMARDLLVLRGNLAVGRWVVPTRAT